VVAAISSGVPPKAARFNRWVAARLSQSAFGNKVSTLIEQQIPG
jgi:hypothetical protein